MYGYFGWVFGDVMFCKVHAFWMLICILNEKVKLQVFKIACQSVNPFPLTQLVATYVNPRTTLSSYLWRGERSLKSYQNEHNSTKETGEKWEKPWKLDPNLVPLPNCTFFHLILQSLRLSQKLFLMKWSLVNAQRMEKKTDWQKCKRRVGEKAGEELKSRLLYHLSIRGHTHKKLASILLSSYTVHLNSLFYSHMVAISSDVFFSVQ